MTNLSFDNDIADELIDPSDDTDVNTQNTEATPEDTDTDTSDLTKTQAEIVEGLVFTDPPKIERAPRKVTAKKYQALFDVLSQPENEGKWAKIPQTFTNAQSASRIAKDFKEQGMKGASRRNEEGTYDAYFAVNPHEVLVGDESDESDSE